MHSAIGIEAFGRSRVQPSEPPQRDHPTTLHALSCVSVTRAEFGLYLASLQAAGTRLSNATLQQLLTVVRLFHAYLMEEGVRANNPAANR
jgi:site-specific recombinase XerD